MGYARTLYHASAVAAALAVTGCASSIMGGYMGEPVQSAMVKYGPPQAAFDMGDGRRAFQWSMDQSYTTPTTVNNQGNANVYGNSVWWTEKTQISGGQTLNSTCNYTMYGRWSESANAWILESFEKPRLMCE